MRFHKQTAQKKQNTAHIKKCNASCKRKGAASNVKKMSILAVCQAIWIICWRRDQNRKTQRTSAKHAWQWLATPDNGWPCLTLPGYTGPQLAKGRPRPAVAGHVLGFLLYIAHKYGKRFALRRTSLCSLFFWAFP